MTEYNPFALTTLVSGCQVDQEAPAQVQFAFPTTNKNEFKILGGNFAQSNSYVGANSCHHHF